MTFTPTPIQPGMDQSTQAAANQDNMAQLQNQSVTQVFRDSTGIDRIIIGKLPDGKSGLKVSKPTIDVTKASDSELVFNSEQNVFKIVSSGTGSVTIPGATAAANTWTSTNSTSTITHNLGYVPAAFVFLDFSATHDNSNLIALPWSYIPTTGPNSGAYINLSFYFALSTTTLTVTASNTVFGTTQATGTYFYKYYLLQETAT